MASLDKMMERLGYVKLERFGLALTADGRIMSLRPAVLDDGVGGKIVGWEDGDLAAMELEPWESAGPRAAAKPRVLTLGRPAPKPAAPSPSTIATPVAGAPAAIATPTPAVAAPAPLARPEPIAAAPASLARPEPIAAAPAPIATPAPIAAAPARAVARTSAPASNAAPPVPVPAPVQPVAAPGVPTELMFAPTVMVPAPARPAGPPEEEDWEWEIAVARARAAADEVEDAAPPPPKAPPRTAKRMPAVRPAWVDDTAKTIAATTETASPAYVAPLREAARSTVIPIPSMPTVSADRPSYMAPPVVRSAARVARGTHPPATQTPARRRAS